MWVIVRLQLLQQRLQHLIHLHCRTADELKHLHNAETHLNCPQTFLSLDSSVGMTTLNYNRRFGIEKS